ncbi:hypothetical protein EEL31_16800 [Brevibacillus laterosporus]|nr:hypothetical protein [Brevibacillus laterosporus]TPG69975.1 hypothetical protein EEL31_16800 [Brevibacillus laterosporus]
MKKVVLSVLSTALVTSMATSAFAASTGYYLGGNIEKYYGAQALINANVASAFQNEVFKSSLTQSQVLYVNNQGKVASLQDIVDAIDNGQTSTEAFREATGADFDKIGGEEGFHTVLEDGTVDPEKKKVPEQDEQPAGDLKVESVSAINASQIKIVFSQKVDETSAESPANVSFDGFTATGYELKDDEKTLIVTTTTPITKKKDVVVTVKNVTLAGDNTVVVPTFTKVITVEDTTPADVTKVESKTSGATATSVDIYFSEPVQSGIVKINGQQYAASFTGNPEKVTVSNLDLDATKTHTLEIVNLTDTAGNKSTVTKSFTITADATAPQVATLSQYSDKAVLVTFDKKMEATTITAGSITIADESLNPVDAGAIGQLPGDTTGTKFIVPINSTLYGTKSSVTLNLAFKDTITDKLGNKIVPSTKQVTLTKDVAAPAVDKVTVKKDAAGKVESLVLDFNKPLKAGTYASDKITVINQDGVDVTGDLLADGTNVAFEADSEAVAAGAKKVEFKLKVATALTGEFTFTFAKGLVQDDAETANDSVSYAKSINFGNADAPEFEITESDVTEAGTNKIQVAFGKTVKGGNVAGSATAVSNYTLNGSALPAGTLITLNTNKDTATITLPASSIPTSDTHAVFTISNVQTLTGLTIKPLTATVAIVDNVAPVLESAKVLDDVTIELTYSEKISLNDTDVFDSFKIVNGTTAIPFTTGELVAGSVSGFDSKIKISINKPGTSDIPAVPPTPGTATVGGKDAGIANIDDQTTANADGTVTYTVAVNGSELQVSDGTKVVTTLDASGDGSFKVNGVTVTITGGADTNTFTVTTEAAVDGTPLVPGTPATKLDLTKAITVETKTTTAVKDVAGNAHKASVLVNVSK